MHKERGFLGVFAAIAVAIASFLSIPFLQTSETLMSNLGGTGTIYNLPIKTFLGLTDTPNSYSGQGTKVVSVKSDESGLEFTAGASGGTPGGSNTQIQFNDSSSFGGDAGFTYDKTTDIGTIGGLNISGQTASKIAIFDGSKNVISADTATYPSLTELSYVKGVTSALQTQINAKGVGTVTSVGTGTGLTGGTITGTGTISLSTPLQPIATLAGNSLKVLRVNSGETAVEYATAGSGTVTNTGGNLTADAVVLGAGTVDTKVVAGITTDGTSQLNLGVNTTTLGKIKMFGNTSGDVTLNPAAVAGTATVLTLPATTDTLIGKATTDTLTNKTYDTAGTGNVFKINGTTITDKTGSGKVVLDTSPTLVTPTLGVASATTINKVTLTAPATGSTLTIADGKTLTSSNTLTLAGTDGKGIDVGAATTGKILVGNGTNMVLSTPTLPVSSSATSGKMMQSDGTNWVASTATWPTAATNNKALIGNGTNYVESTPTVPFSSSATSGKIIKSDGTNWVASTETYAAPGTNKNVMKSDGTNWTSAAPTFEGLVEAISFQDAGTSIAATTYVLELYAEYAYTINEMRIISGAGTVTANLKIGSTSVTSCSAVSVTTTITSCTASGANTVAVGDKITLVTTSNSGLNDLQATIKTTRN